MRWNCLPAMVRRSMLDHMFTVDDVTVEAIRRACAEGDELAGAVELRRHFPLIIDTILARDCVRRIVGWRLAPEPMHGRK